MAAKPWLWTALVAAFALSIQPGSARAADVVQECRELVELLNLMVSTGTDQGEERPAVSQPHSTGRLPVTRRKRNRPYEAFILSAASAHGVDPELVHAIVQVESGYDPGAVGAAGERGLMQLMPGTARLVGCHKPLSPADNVWGGTKYLRMLLDEFGWNLKKAVAAYNCGPSRVHHARIPASTQRYVRDVLGRYELVRKVQ